MGTRKKLRSKKGTKRLIGGLPYPGSKGFNRVWADINSRYENLSYFEYLWLVLYSLVAWGDDKHLPDKHLPDKHLQMFLDYYKKNPNKTGTELYGNTPEETAMLKKIYDKNELNKLKVEHHKHNPDQVVNNGWYTSNDNYLNSLVERGERGDNSISDRNLTLFEFFNTDPVVLANFRALPHAEQKGINAFLLTDPEPAAKQEIIKTLTSPPSRTI